MAFAELDGVRLFYTDDCPDPDDGGSPMLFVHGFSCDSHDWSWQLPHFATGRRVIAFDLRGHGRSSVPDDGYGVGSLAADAAALIEHLGCAPVIAVGHSLGGAISATVAAERPELVRAVVCVDPGHLVPDEAGPGLASVLDAYLARDPALVAKNAFDGASHTAATPAALATWHNRRAAGMPVEALRKTMAGLLGGENPFVLRRGSEPVLSRVSQPVLSFCIDTARAAITREVFTHPSSRVVCFEGSGHWLHQELPGEVNSLIDGWLAELP